MKLYSPHSRSDFDQWFAHQLRSLSQAVEATLGDNLVALALGGGYGRHEGAVIEREGRQWPYNDLDLTLVVQRPGGVWRLLQPVAHHFASEMKIEVDFSRPLTPAQVRTWPHTLMWHELLVGHQVLSGPADFFQKNAPAHLWQLPPLAETARLLLNRGAGLLWASQEGHLPDADFVRRNFYKAWLAAGDAALMWAGTYRVAYSEREQAFRQLPWAWPLTAEQYAQALRFKFLPDGQPCPEPELVRQTFCQAWLAFESRRLQQAFEAPLDYYHCLQPREEWSPSLIEKVKNLARNLRVGRFGLQHPRQHLYRELPLLLSRPPSRAARSFLRVWRLYN